MKLPIHIFTHIVLSIISGMIVGYVSQQYSISLTGALLGGVFVDLDHLLDYYVAFKFHFRLNYFLKGYAFLKNNKIIVLLHGWECVIVLLIIASITYGINSGVSAFSASIAIGLLCHLCIDTHVNRVYARSYSIVYRIMNRYAMDKCIPPHEYEAHLSRKAKLNL